MKKVVFIIESLNLGGAERSLVTLLQNINYDKYNIDLITFLPGGFFNDFVQERVNRVVIYFPKISIINRFLYAIKRNKFIVKQRLKWFFNNFKRGSRIHVKIELFWKKTNQLFAEKLIAKEIKCK